MWKEAIAIACLGATSGPLGSPQSGRFSGLAAVETYEIRPGILVMPKYADDGQLCEVGVQRRLYSPEKIIVDANLTGKEVEEIFEELVAAGERGPRLEGRRAEHYTEVGNVVTRVEDFENVSLEIVSKDMTPSRHKRVLDTVVAIIRWKNRRCR